MTEQQPAGQQGHRLGEMLRAARESGGMNLSELSRSTAVRRDYLEALEESRYADLPEPVYVRNFVRLYAQAVGLDAQAALQMYASETSQPAAAREPLQQAEPAARGKATAAAVATEQPERERSSSRPAGRRANPGAWLPTLILVVLVVGLAVWGFNSTLFRPGTVQSPPAEDEAAAVNSEPQGGAQAAPAAEQPSPAAATVRLSVSTEPPGARVLVDSFPLEGLTPISLAPVTARDPRLIRVELDGYEAQETSVDLTFDRNISFVLQEAAEPADSEATVAEGSQEPAPADGTITVTVTDESWLEIYPGTAREGTPHVYTTAQSGQEYTFDLPVFIRVGNAAGISVSVGGQNLGPLGSAGEITGRAFTEAD